MVINMSIISKHIYHINTVTLYTDLRNCLSCRPFGVIQNNWNAACTIYSHAAFAVNILLGGALWHVSALTMAIANTTPAPAGNSPTARLLPTKYARLSCPASMSTTSTVSKPTTVTQTSPSFRHPLMPKYTTNNFHNQTAAGAHPAAQSLDAMYIDGNDTKKQLINSFEVRMAA